MDKVVFKEVMHAVGVPQVRSAGVREARWRADPAAVRAELAQLGTPIFVKPARLGSSVGIAKVWAEADVEVALEGAFAHDSLVIAEAFSDGLEIECSVIGLDEPEVSVPGEIVLAGAEWYDYDAKYSPGGMELRVPAPVSEDVRERVRELAVDVFRRVGCAGMARIDFFVADPEDAAGVLVNELNTIPGFTATSVYAKLFDASGLPYVELLDRLLTLALERHERERRYRY
jgi:D-alanine-D-alanine ligase